MQQNNINPYHLNWGKVTSDGFNQSENQLLLVFNIDLSSPKNRQRAAVFVTGRVLWFRQHVPANISYNLVFDFRGQGTHLAEGRLLVDELKAEIKRLDVSINLITNILT